MADLASEHRGAYAKFAAQRGEWQALIARSEEAPSTLTAAELTELFGDKVVPLHKANTPKPQSSAAMPFMITKLQKQRLSDLGYSKQAINEMKPAEVQEILNKATAQQPQGSLELALDYIGRGWNPVPVGFKTKKPISGAWERIIIDAEAAPRYFNARPQNVGVQLGPNSHGLVDADLDSAEAIAIAPYLMPRTDAVFGRPSKRFSHQLYATDLYKSEARATVQFKDPIAKQHGHKEMLLELRIGGGSKGAQTVFPGSTHESGEAISWERDGKPAKVDGAKLLWATTLTACAALLARYWPAQGGRHDAALTLGGFLARAGFDDSEIALITEAIAKAAGDPEWKDRVRAAKDHAKYHTETGKGHGLPKLNEIFGERIGNKVAKWLCYNDASDATEEPLVITAAVYDFPGERQIPRREFLYGRHLLRRTVSVTAGIGAVGKSSKSIVDALAMASGKALIGIEVTKALRVLLINLEDDRAEMDRRIAATMKHYGLSKDDVGGRLIVIAKGELKIKIATQERMGVIEPNEQAIAALIKLILEQKIDVISIDPLRKMHRVSENDTTAMGELIECFECIAEATNCAVHLWHHNRKGNNAETTVDSLRGASSIVDAARSIEMLETMTEKAADKFGVLESDRKRYFRCFNGKVNFAPPVESSSWFERINVTLDNGAVFGGGSFGGDEVGVVVEWKQAVITPYLTEQNIEAIKDMVRKSDWRDDVRAAMWVGKAIEQVTGIHDRGQLQRLQCKLLEDKVLRIEPGQDERRHAVLFVRVVE